MKAVFSGAQMLHAPRHFLSKGEIIAYPDSPERARALLSGARAAGAQIFAAREFDLEHFPLIHHKPYLDFLAESFEEYSKEPGAGRELLPSLRPLVRPTQVSSNILGRAGGT